MMGGCKIIRLLFLGLFPCAAMALPDGTLKPLNQYFCLAPICRYPTDQNLYDRYSHSLMYYYGITAKEAFIRIVFGNFHRWPEHIQSIEYAHTLCLNNPVRRFFWPIVGVVQLAADFTLRVGSREHTIYEFDPYISFRWANFPWNHFITTSFMAGEGISYVTSIPWIERRNNNNTKRLLNLMILEATFAAPQYPRVQLVARVHHRSGAYGLYHAGNTGSNDVGLGLRYLFE